MDMNVTRSGAAVLGAALLVLSAVGCSSASTSSPSTSKTPVPSGSPSPHAGIQHQVDPCKGLKPATGRPARTFGGKKVTAGYCEMLRLTLEGSFLSVLMQESSFRPDQFAAFRTYMTPVAQRAWDRDVATISASGERQRGAFDNVLSITYLDVTGHGYTLGNSQTPQPVSNRTFSPGRAGVIHVHGAPRLSLSLHIDFQFNLTDKKTGGAMAVHGRKSVTYTLAENPVASKDKPWLIDGWHGTSRFGKIKQVASGQ
jgi:hypothetical protein